MTGYTLIGRAGDVPALEGRSLWVGGRRIAVFHTADGFRAVDGACPHAGGPLADGIVGERCVTCPLHGRRYDLHTGADLSGGEGVRTYEVLEQAGELWLRVGDGELAQAA